MLTVLQAPGRDVRQKNTLKHAQQAEGRAINAPSSDVHDTNASMAQFDANHNLHSHLFSHNAAAQAQGQRQGTVADSIIHRNSIGAEHLDPFHSWTNGTHRLPGIGNINDSAAPVVAPDVNRASGSWAAATPVVPSGELQLRRRLTSDNGDGWIPEELNIEKNAENFVIAKPSNALLGDVEKKVKAAERQWGQFHPETGKAQLSLYQTCMQNSPEDPEVRRRAELALTRLAEKKSTNEKQSCFAWGIPILSKHSFLNLAMNSPVYSISAGRLTL